MARHRAPARLCVATRAGAREWIRVDDHHARLHGCDSGGAPPVLELGDGGVRVYEGRAPRGARASQLGVVYRLGEHGSLAVATGAVLVRFRPGVAAVRRAAALSRAGFAIEQVLGFAPHCAWVRAASGRATDALADLDRLRELRDVEAVEPQLLMERHGRGGVRGRPHAKTRA
jgi:hypothetical protein